MKPLITLLLALAACLTAAAQDTEYFFGILYQSIPGTNTCKVIYADTYAELAAAKPQISVASSVDINGKKCTVTAIDDGAFCETAFTSISLPEGITSIGDFAFEGCEDLTYLNIPSTVTTIGEEAFGGAPCFGSKVQISVNLCEIGFAAFCCPGLTEYSVAVGNPNFCSIDGVLFSKDRKTLIDYPWGRPAAPYTVPAGTTTIAQDAFSGRHLTSLTLPEGLTTIIEYAFWGATIDGPLTLPASLTDISEDAFSECHGVTAFNIAPANTTFVSRDGVLFSKDMTTLRLYPIGRPADAYIVPDGVTTIGANAFRAAQNLKHLYLPEGLTTISPVAVYGCEGLTELIIPASVTTIGGYAFGVCKSLANIYCRSTVPAQAGEGAFYYTAKGCTLHIPTGTKAAYINKGWNGNYLSNYSEEAQVTPPCATPVITVNGGKFSVTCATPGARIICEYESSEFSANKGWTGPKLYSTPKLTIKAYAIAEGYTDSADATCTITSGNNDIDGSGATDLDDLNTLIDGILQK